MNNVEVNDIIERYTNPVLIYTGGQRTVYKINHPQYGNVALKIGTYKTTTNQSGWDIERIEREIEILNKIDSPYYPKNYEFSKISNDRYIILEEFIESVPLSNSMNRFQTPFQILALIKDLTIGLKIIWGFNIVHRDLKPDNILISKEGTPIIIDLGIARKIDIDSITRTIFGGPCSRLYAAPELLKYDKKFIDERTDQFNLGIILMQLLLKGTHPFEPTLVGGNSIPENIIKDNWYKRELENPDSLPMKKLAYKLLGNHPYQRFRTDDLLIIEINSCLEVYNGY